jgi:transcriptional regulator with XRE-family HTH domain
MELSARRQAPTVRLRRLASELRALRKAADLTQDDVFERTSINVATLFRIEKAHVRPQKRTLIALLDVYGVTDPAERERLLAMSREANRLGWLQAYEDQIGQEYSTYVSFESEARSVRNYESLFIPGLLQTEDYARAVIRGVLPHVTDDEVTKRVEVRMQRQGVLDKSDPLRLWCVMDEAAVRRSVGGDKVMKSQLTRLIDAATVPTTVLQVIPYGAGAHPGMPGSFVVMDFAEPTDPEIVYIDSMAGDLFLERGEDVERFATVFEHLRAAALSPADTTRLLRAVVND